MLTLVLFLAVLSVAPAQQPVSSSQRQIVFRDVNVIPMSREVVLPHQSVVIKEGRIVAVGPVNKVKHDRDALIVDAKDKYLLPGLAEMHAHVPPNDNVESMKEVLTLFTLNGITTIRGMLGHPKHLALRDSIREGKFVGPNFYTTGPSFNGSSVVSPEEGAAMVRRQKEAGYDYLKLHPGLTRAKFDAIAATAKEVGIPFVGHVSYDVGVWRAIEAGYSSIDHLDGFIEGLVPDIEKIPEEEAGFFGMNVADKIEKSRIAKLMSALKAKKIWVVPTQSLAERWIHPDYTSESFMKDPDRIYMKKETVDQWLRAKQNMVTDPDYDPEKLRRYVDVRRELIRECQKNGVGLLLGCDAPQVFNVPGFSTHNELEYLVKSGLSPYQALLTGTLNVATYLGNIESGIIAVGAVSDLIVLSSNPLSDISNTRKIEGVMIGDKWMDKEYITAGLRKSRK